MKQKVLVRGLAAAGVLVVALGGYANLGMGSPHQKGAAAEATTASSSLPATTSTMPSFSWIVEKYGSAVVNVSVTGEARAVAGDMPQLDPDDPLNQFFKRFGIPGQGQGPRGGAPMHGVGSG